MDTVDPERAPTTIPSTSSRSQLETYQLLVGDTNARESSNPNDESIYHMVLAKERKAAVVSVSTTAIFFLMIMAQIGLCLGIAIGAQLGLTNKQISILAGVNTGVWQRGYLKAGIDVDAVKEADEMQMLEDAARDDAQINFAGLETVNKGDRNKKIG
ncbi:unnamed protein product [Clonostachys solani]|uniref:Uncharacterized protein n=1 Tax=Clonostachys solani TaxID=160281 RepID=A0A9N9ZHV6_9HYPO|nr:unnamed protein product [Clonostachys solani]